jgi:hypothetical protein
MTIRIRYHKDPKNNRLVSSTITSRIGAKYKVRLYPDEMRYEIVNLGNGNIVKRGESKAKDIRYLKEMVRRNIKSSGLAIDLKPEIRRKNNV